MVNRTINNREMKTEIDISCREQSPFSFFNTHDHTAVVMIIASFNINWTISFVYMLLCSSRKSNYSQHSFSSFLTIYKGMAGTLPFDSSVCLDLFVCERYVIYFYCGFKIHGSESFMNNYCIHISVSTSELPNVSGENKKERNYFFNDL